MSSTVTTQEARRSLYEVIRNEASFEQKAHEALKLGEDYLDVDNGHLTRIDLQTDHWEAMVSTDPPDGQFPPGLELDLGTTYCRRTIETDSPIALHDASTQGWADDPAFNTHDLDCYHGTTLVLDGNPYGTVCFVAADTRRGRFSETETMFAELLTRLLERELERKQHEAELTRQTNLATVLNRVLRHNCRNDLSVIRGFTQLMANDRDDGYGEIALDKIDDLIELSEKARELNRIVTTSFERESAVVPELVEEAVETVSQGYPSASITAEYDDELTAPVLPSFERALEEVIENAAKHSGETPTVTVTVEPVPNAIEIRIADDGPGLAEHEADVLDTGTETPLTHGTGLGLWIAHWIMTSHGGSVEATVTDAGTEMTCSLPRNPATNVREQLDELTQARDKYQSAFEEASDAMVIINDDARIVDANSKAAAVYGLDRQELLGQSMARFLPEEFDFEAEWQRFRNAGRERDTVTIVDADNETHPIEYSATTDIVPGQHLIISRELLDRSSL